MLLMAKMICSSVVYAARLLVVWLCQQLRQPVVSAVGVTGTQRKGLGAPSPCVLGVGHLCYSDGSHRAWQTQLCGIQLMMPTRLFAVTHISTCTAALLGSRSCVAPCNVLTLPAPPYMHHSKATSPLASYCVCWCPPLLLAHACMHACPSPPIRPCSFVSTACFSSQAHTLTLFSSSCAVCHAVCAVCCGGPGGAGGRGSARHVGATRWRRMRTWRGPAVRDHPTQQPRCRRSLRCR